MKIGFLILFPVFTFIMVTFLAINSNLPANSSVSFGNASYGFATSSTTTTVCQLGSSPVVAPCQAQNGYFVSYVLNQLFVGTAIALIVAGTVLAGLQIFGSGLSPEAVHTIYVAIAFGSLYIALAPPTIAVFSLIPYGLVLFGVLSLMYFIGVIGLPLRGN